MNIQTISLIISDSLRVAKERRLNKMQNFILSLASLSFIRRGIEGEVSQGQIVCYLILIPKHVILATLDKLVTEKSGVLNLLTSQKLSPMEQYGSVKAKILFLT